jgi:hypothetical protein
MLYFYFHHQVTKNPKGALFHGRLMGPYHRTNPNWSKNVSQWKLRETITWTGRAWTREQALLLRTILRKVELPCVYAQTFPRVFTPLTAFWPRTTSPNFDPARVVLTSVEQGTIPEGLFM